MSRADHDARAPVMSSSCLLVEQRSRSERGQILKRVPLENSRRPGEACPDGRPENAQIQCQAFEEELAGSVSAYSQLCLLVRVLMFSDANGLRQGHAQLPVTREARPEGD